jgi:hypothetical protein
MIGTSFAYVTNKLVLAMPGAAPTEKMAYAAAAVAASVLLLGSILSFFLPEPGLVDAQE